jgi:hypothetical protein
MFSVGMDLANIININLLYQILTILRGASIIIDSHIPIAYILMSNILPVKPNLLKVYSNDKIREILFGSGLGDGNFEMQPKNGIILGPILLSL